MTRKEAIEILKRNKPTSDPRRCGTELCEAVDMAIEALQEQGRKKGKWEEIRNSYGELEGFIHIGCGYTSLGRYKFCPSCGAYMWGESND